MLVVLVSCSRQKQEVQPSGVLDTTSHKHSQLLVSDSTETLKPDLVGLWQLGSHEVAAGYHDNYRFFADSTFIFAHTDFNWAKRELSYSGTYILKGSDLTITIRARNLQVGGHIEHENSGMYEGPVLVDAKEADIQLKSPLHKVYRFRGYFVDTLASRGSFEPVRIGLRIYLGKSMYGKISNDPNHP
jgi:hypothetical protein